MANVFYRRTFVNGSQDYVCYWAAMGDNTGAITNSLVNTFGELPTTARLMKITIVSPLSLTVSWDGGTPALLLPMPGNAAYTADFSEIGGIQNNAITPTGDLTVSSTGTITAGRFISIILEMRKT